MAEEEERIQMELLREIEMEELQIEEVDDADTSSSDDQFMDHGNDGGVDEFRDVIYDPCLVSIDSYLDEVVDARNSVTFLDGGAILNLPMFYVEGVVLLPEATLSLKIINRRFRASVERALNQVGPPTIGVVHLRNPDNERLCFSTVGTTAEIQQYRLSEDGSYNVLARGKERFQLGARWIDAEGAPCAEVQIIREDLPLRTPRDAFGQLASITNFWKCSPSHQVPPYVSHAECARNTDDNDSESVSEISFENDLSPAELQLHLSTIKSHKRYDSSEESTSSNRSLLACELGQELRRSCTCDSGRLLEHDLNACSNEYQLGLQSKYVNNDEGWKVWAAADLKMSRRAPRSFWPQWVYRMYDSYGLAQKAAAMWKQIIKVPRMDNFAKKPDLLSFHIASKIPVSDSSKQDLLETIGISYRLRREIEFLEFFDEICCKTCQSVIAKRSEMLAISSDGPRGAYAKIDGYVHEIMTFNKASGLALVGRPSEEYSWFQGYAWTVTTCAICKSIMGWLFTSTDKILRPESFWALWSSKVADNICLQSKSSKRVSFLP